MSQEMSGNVSLTVKQLKFLRSLLEGNKIIDAASAAGVVERTAHRWLNDATFISEYEKARKQLLNQSLANLHSKFGKAVETLEKHLGKDTKSIPRDQIEASKTVITQTVQTAQLVERIRDLEAHLASRDQEELYTIKFDLRKLTDEEKTLLRRVNADVNARYN